MDASSLPSIYSSATAACTYEGENTVLYLQAARYLVKACKRVMAGGTLPPTVKYLKMLRNGPRITDWENSFESYVTAHERVAFRSDIPQ